MNGSASTSAEIVSVGGPLPRLVRVEALDGRKLRVTFRSGEIRIVDLAPVLASRRIYLPLRTDDALFRTVDVNEDGNAVGWGPDLDLSALWLARLPPVDFDNADFRHAMDRLGLSLDGMAAALGVSRRLVADYRKEKPIPRHIGLATRYLLEHV